MIRRRPLLLAPLFLGLGLGLPALRAADEPEKDSPQKIVDDAITEITALEKIYASVTDEASATKAAPTVEKSADALVAIVKRMEKFPTPPADIVKKFSDFMRKAGKHLDALNHDLKEKSPKAAEILDQATSKLDDNPPPRSWIKLSDDDAPPPPPPPPPPP